MKRIVHICMSQYSDGWTYQENLLSKYHTKIGFDVIVLTSMYCYKEGQLTKDLKTDFRDVNRVRIIRLKTKKYSLLKKLPVYTDFLKKLEELKPDIIFSHGCQYIDTKNVVKYIQNNPKTILYVDNHADFTNSATNWISRYILHGIIWKKCAWNMLPYAKKFWGVLPARVDFLRNVYKLPDEKCELLVMGADDEQVDISSTQNIIDRIRKENSVKNDDFLIVTGGKIDKAKTQTLLLMEAVAKINEPKLKLIIFGSIDKEIESTANKWIDGERIIYIGWINSEKSYEYFASADLVAFPGRHSVFWEQVAGMGIPILARKWEGITHIDCGGNTIFLENDSVDEIKKKLEYILQSEVYNSMKAKAEECKKNFLYSKIAKRSIECND